jgi:hypothetical protein
MESIVPSGTDLHNLTLLLAIAAVPLQAVNAKELPNGVLETRQLVRNTLLLLLIANVVHGKVLEMQQNVRDMH